MSYRKDTIDCIVFDDTDTKDMTKLFYCIQFLRSMFKYTLLKEKNDLGYIVISVENASPEHLKSMNDCLASYLCGWQNCRDVMKATV